MSPGFLHFAVGEFGFILAQLAFLTGKLIFKRFESTVQLRSLFGDLRIARITRSIGARDDEHA